MLYLGLREQGASRQLAPFIATDAYTSQANEAGREALPRLHNACVIVRACAKFPYRWERLYRTSGKRSYSNLSVVVAPYSRLGAHVFTRRIRRPTRKMCQLQRYMRKRSRKEVAPRHAHSESRVLYDGVRVCVREASCAARCAGIERKEIDSQAWRAKDWGLVFKKTTSLCH